MTVAISVLAFLFIVFAGLQIWRVRSRDFRAECTVETLKIWRGLVKDYRKRHPLEKINMSVDEEAVYMAMKSKNRDAIALQARRNVSAMTKYQVQECNPAPSGLWYFIYAHSEKEAAEKLVAKDVSESGNEENLAALVRRADQKPPTQFSFYRR